MNPYAKRNSILKSLGFDTYADYLASKLWAKIRVLVFAKGKRCVKCKSKATEIHHEDYSRKVLLGKDLSKLHPVCNDCHHGAEFDEDGKKRYMQEANRILLKIEVLVSEAPAPQAVGKFKKKKKRVCRMCWVQEEPLRLVGAVKNKRRVLLCSECLLVSTCIGKTQLFRKHPRRGRKYLSDLRQAVLAVRGLPVRDQGSKWIIQNFPAVRAELADLIFSGIF